MKTLAAIALSALGLAAHAQSGEILSCDPQHPKYEECQRQLERQQRGTAERRDIEATKNQQIFKGLDPYKSVCNAASPSYNECERQRIVAIRQYKLPQSPFPTYANVIRPVKLRCDPQKKLYAECEAERESYERMRKRLANAVAEQNRQDREKQNIREGTRDGIRDAVRGY